MIRHFIAPEQADKGQGRIKLFFGGSIELGKAEDWQARLFDHLCARPYADQLDVYNPRRGGSWDPSWNNNESCAPFREQVDWELYHQKDADLLLYYFAADTISPISLFELGLFHGHKPVVGVDPAYTRIGNLMVTKDHFDLDINLGWDEFIKALEQRLSAIYADKVAA